MYGFNLYLPILYQQLIMKQAPILKYIISYIALAISLSSFSQSKDTITYTSAYGLRLGIDISKPILGMIDSNSSGIEFVADYRISNKWYVAAEIGNQKERTVEDYTTSNSQGNFLEKGVRTVSPFKGCCMINVCSFCLIS